MAASAAVVLGALAVSGQTDDGERRTGLGAGGQVPLPPPFDPFGLDDETGDAYFLHLVAEHTAAGTLGTLEVPGGAVFTVTLPPSAHAAMTGGDWETASDHDDEVVVGSVGCWLNVRPPAREGYDTVAARAGAGCEFVPSGEGVPPPPNVVSWTLRMTLIDSDNAAVAVGRFDRVGWDVEWVPGPHLTNVWPQPPETVVTAPCVSGYGSTVAITLDLPPPYSYSGPQFVGFGTASASVDCGSFGW